MTALENAIAARNRLRRRLADLPPPVKTRGRTRTMLEECADLERISVTSLLENIESEIERLAKGE